MFDTSPEDLTRLRFDLSTQGSLVLTDARGKRLFIIASHLLNTTERGLLVSYESGGCFFWKAEFLTKFQLMAHGFNLTVASALVDFLHALYSVKEERPAALIEASEDDPADLTQTEDTKKD